MTRPRRVTARRSTFGALIAAVVVMASLWLPSTVASASPSGGGSVAGLNGAALSGGNGGCFFAGCGPQSVAGAGGGASSVQLCSATDPNCVSGYYTATEPRLVVAGGGGGAGGYDGCSGGSAGGGTGPASTPGNCGGGGGGGNGTGGAGQQLNCGTNGGGAGATPAAAGAGGAGEAGQENGTAGNGPVGGDGYTSEASAGGGGGGGGGYYGAGGGGATNDCNAYGNGGGGGSSFSVAAMTVGNDTTATPGVSLSYGSGPTVQTFTPGAEQTFVVPVGVTSIDVVATGGRGGNNAENDGFGGYGAVVSTTIAATPGQTLYIDVASNGTNQFQAPAPVISNVSGTATYGGTATLSATLQDDGVALSGKTVDFTLDGAAAGSGTTAGNGVATVSGVSIGSDDAGNYPGDVVATFAGDGTYTSASGSGDLVVSKASQVLTITSTPPSSPVVGDSYNPAATGGGSTSPVVFSIDAATTNNACTISNGTVSFDHPGTCVIDADQAGDDNYTAALTAQQQATVDKAPQVVAFSSTPPSTPGLGDTYTPTATGGGSNNPVVFSIDAATTNNACSISSGTVSFDHAGTCVIDADQAGDNDYTAALTAQQQVAIGKAAQAVNFSSTPPSTPGLGDTYTPTATGGGSNNPVVFSIDAATTNNACSISSGTVSFDHAGTCVIDADQAGDNDHDVAPTAHQQVGVGHAATVTVLTIGPSSLSATVAAPSVPSRTVTGAVDFTVNGHGVGSGLLNNGSASLAHTLPPGRSYAVVATYQASGDFATSSDSAQRTDPTIDATVHSAKSRSAYGWYSHPVTIRFTCTPGSAALSSPCPGPVTLSHGGAGQHVSRSVLTADGGAATATVTGIDIDRTAPKLTVKGMRNGGVYRGKARQGRCIARDSQSGVVRCKLRTSAGHDGQTRYVATAVNQAGLKASKHGSYRILTIWIPRARYTHATGFQLRVGAYNLRVASSTRPLYEWAAPANTSHPANRPRGGNATFTRAATGVWQMTFHVTPSMARRYKVWNLGVRIHGHLHLVRITVHRGGKSRRG